MAPAPIAITVKATNMGVSKPMLDSIGAIIPAVVVNATVEEPWAVFKIADNKKGNINPRAARVVEFSLMKSTIEVFAITVPRTPPAAVINRIGPVIFSVSLVSS